MRAERVLKSLVFQKMKLTVFSIHLFHKARACGMFRIVQVVKLHVGRLFDVGLLAKYQVAPALSVGLL
jgi:hypothetical protein